ncbi:hypothetical protein FQN49_001257 [Arthroderma sp. PD_2]|nr:hypothetical protein FQN49_001257 [Arthroderma sp. PD_2]
MTDFIPPLSPSLTPQDGSVPLPPKENQEEPTPASAMTPASDKPLTKFEQVVHLPRTINVALNTISCIGSNDKANDCLVAENINGSTVILIVSQTAALMANVLPRPGVYDLDPTSGDRNMMIKLRDIETHVVIHRDDFRFPGTRAWALYAAIDGMIVLQDQLLLVERTFARMGLTQSTRVSYPVIIGQPRLAGYGTIVIDVRTGVPEVYIDNELVS